MGSKARLAKDIVPIITRNLYGTDRVYVEPFMGGCNILSEVDHGKKYGFDCNSYLVDMWNGLKDFTFLPPMRVTEEEYYDMKNDYMTHGGKYSKAMLGYAMFCCSYGSKPWAGYARLNEKRGEDHIKEAWRNISAQVCRFKHLRETEFLCYDYTECLKHISDLEHPIVMYCDPPYKATQKYQGGFDSDKFFDWVRTASEAGHEIYVSEYNAPGDFVCIWEKGINDGLALYKDGMSQVKKTERLYCHPSVLKNFPMG